MTVRDSYYPVAITFLLVDGIAVGLRFWARGLKKAIGYDDIVMAVSLIGFVIFCAMELQAINYGIGASTTEPGYNAIKAAMYFTVAQLVYILASGISKLGVGLVLFRLADMSDMRIIRFSLILSMVIVSIWTLVVCLIFALQCRPLSVAWGVGKGTCLSTSTIGKAAIALSAEDVAVSWFYALIPIPMLIRTQLRPKLKISILVVLGLGAVSSVATIIRLKFAIEVANMQADGGLAAENIIQTTLEATIYSILEIGLSIFAASLTALRPLLKKIPLFSDISSGGRSGSKGFNSINTFGRVTDRSNGPAYRLEDRNVSDGDSQENIIPSRSVKVRKETIVESAYTVESPPINKRQTDERW